jgi:hypothetical protein
VKWFFCFSALLVGATLLCQTAPPVSKQFITLEKIGHGYWKPNRPFGIRVYSTPDGTKVTVKYLTFSSRAEAKEYLRTCLRPEAEIIYKQEKKGPDGEVVGERLIATSQQSGKEEFALIRGVRLNYHFFGSSSLAAAQQVEAEELAEKW